MEDQEGSCVCDNGDPKPTSSRKKIKENMLESGNWDRCMQFLPKKKRYCNMARTDGSEYCGVHMATSKRGDRIPCPIDPSHTVWSLQLNAHLKICNVATANQQLIRQPYYSENINSGTTLPPSISPRSIEVSALVDKVRRVFSRLEPIPNVFLTENDGLLLPSTSSFAEFTQQKSAFSRRRHGLQATSLVAHLQRKGLLLPVNYVEMGAGKGLLGLAVKSAAPKDARVILVERSGVRRKADRGMREAEEPSSSPVEAFLRARVDIRHVKLAGLPLKKTCDASGDASNAVVVMVAKHLCGVATDLALRSLISSTSDEKEETLRPRVGGVAIATCCHHACNMQDYVSREWMMQECDVSCEEFEVLRRWSGWTTLVRATHGATTTTTTTTTEDDVDVKKRTREDNNSTDSMLNKAKQARMSAADVGDDDDEEDGGNDEDQEEKDGETKEMDAYSLAVAQIPVEEKAAVGRMIKRIFDYGRILFLRSLGLEAEIVHYCDEEISPENALLIAWPKTSAGAT